jgi:hypothetical protein
MKKEFPLSIEEDKAFRYYVELISPFLKKLRPKELDVFSEILYQYYLKKGVANKRDRLALVLNSDGRELIAERLNISQAILRNAVSAIRKKGFLKEDNTISDVYLLDLNDKKLELSFIFTIN